MLNNKLKLNKEIFAKNVEKVPTRTGFGEGLVFAGESDDKVVALCADLTESTKILAFKEKFPDRFIEVGVAEQLLATLASGMAAYGKIPFISSYAVFSPGRNWEQIRTTIALNDVPVKIAGSHSGVSVGPDGATHQALEDLALMRVLPNMIVVYPCDALEAKKATIEIAKNGKPTYIRLAREKTPILTTQNTPFKVGKTEFFWEEKDPQVALIATGPLLYEALVAAKQLMTSNINCLVINCHTIKPLDEQTIIKAARLAGCVVTIEEHQITGGLGGAVAETLSKNFPTPQEFIGMPDHFGESGQQDELLSKWGMKAKDIVEAAMKVIKRRTA